MDTTADILRKAKAHISDPAMWHKGSLYAGDEFTKETPCCAVGALYAAGGRFDLNASGIMRSLDHRLYDASMMTHGVDAVDFNDDPDTTHADVMDLFDRAIAAAEADQ